MGGDEARLELDGASERRFGSAPVPVVPAAHHAGDGVGLGKLGIEGERFDHRLPHLANVVDPFSAAVDPLIDQRCRQGGMREREVRVASDRLLERRDGASQAGRGELLRVEAAFDIRLVRIGPDAGRMSSGRRQGPAVDVRGDGPCNVGLQRQHVAKRPVVAAAPELAPCGRVHQHHVQPHALTGPHERPLEHGIHVQFTRDLGQRAPVGRAKAPGRCRGNDFERIETRQFGNETRGHAIDEGRSAAVVSQVRQREHGDAPNEGVGRLKGCGRFIAPPERLGQLARERRHRQRRRETEPAPGPDDEPSQVPAAMPASGRRCRIACVLLDGSSRRIRRGLFRTTGAPPGVQLVRVRIDRPELRVEQPVHRQSLTPLPPAHRRGVTAEMRRDRLPGLEALSTWLRLSRLLGQIGHRAFKRESSPNPNKGL